MRIAICDDEKIFRDEITDCLDSYFGKLDLDCFTFSDGSELICAYENGETFQAVFLDIEMPKLDGLKTAAMLRKMGVEVPIIFLTSHTEFAMEGYEVYAFRFLAKPLNQEKMRQTLNDLKEALFVKKRLLIKADGEEILLVIDDIIYVEAMNNSISIVTEKENYCVRKKLGEMEKELNSVSDTFVKIHRGYIVNLSKVEKQHQNEVIMSDGIHLPISRTAVSDFKKRLFEYIKEQAR